MSKILRLALATVYAADTCFWCGEGKPLKIEGVENAYLPCQKCHDAWKVIGESGGAILCEVSVDVPTLEGQPEIDHHGAMVAYPTGRVLEIDFMTGLMVFGGMQGKCLVSKEQFDAALEVTGAEEGLTEEDMEEASGQ